MPAIFIIVFREVLEISLIISIVLAATKDVPGRNLLALVGVFLGMGCATLLAIFTSAVSSAMQGYGQEIFSALILSLAIMMIAWTIIWMKKYANKLAKQAKAVGVSIKEGRSNNYLITVIIAATIVREGAEIILFSYGIMAATKITTFEAMVGICAAITAGSIAGLMMYFGLLKISGRYIFKISSFLLILLAAGMAAQVANYLAAAQIINSLSETVWNSSWLISEQSIAGKVLHATMGYSESPSILQLIFYATTLTVISFMAYQTSRKVTLAK